MSKGGKTARLTPRRSGCKGPLKRPWKKLVPKGKEVVANHFLRRWRQRVNRAGSKVDGRAALNAINNDIQKGEGKFAVFVWSESTNRSHWKVEAAGQSWHVVYNSKIGSVVTIFADPIANGGEIKRLNKRKPNS